jgi:nucleoredoxin
MKTSILSLCITASLFVTASAEFRTWTRSDGKTAELEIVSVRPDGEDDSVGTFKMRNGAKVDLKASTLIESDAQLLKDWKPAEKEKEKEKASSTAAGGASVFDEILEGNLVRLDGKKFKSCKDATKPTKCYLFYYTASWCGPCQRFTPELVKFYESNKNENFELVLITSDQDEDSMELYAREKKMPWPQLKIAKAERFKAKFDHGVTGIPCVVACDLEGKVLAKGQSLDQIKTLIK